MIEDRGGYTNVTIFGKLQRRNNLLIRRSIYKGTSVMMLLFLSAKLLEQLWNQRKMLFI